MKRDIILNVNDNNTQQYTHRIQHTQFIKIKCVIRIKLLQRDLLYVCFLLIFYLSAICV